MSHPALSRREAANLIHVKTIALARWGAESRGRRWGFHTGKRKGRVLYRPEDVKAWLDAAPRAVRLDNPRVLSSGADRCWLIADGYTTSRVFMATNQP